MSIYVVTLLVLLVSIATLVGYRLFFLKPLFKHSEKRKRKRKKKRVTFNPHVEVANAGGTKFDRHNPDLKFCVARNSALAMQAGGSKHLAEISLSAAS